tara:strand:+ start:192 stop:560 length:369 start_codon:yes stop_codon:yes gene_type:complete
MKKIFFIYLFFSLNSLTVQANEMSDLEQKIFKNIRCLVCQGQSVADSNSEFSQTIKLVVKDQIGKGRSETEIYDFLVDKYGEWIIYDPLFSTSNFLLWFLPYFILLVGGLFIFFILKKKNNN